MVVVFLLVFFFKQKTAYEMRISDWSSDVSSSDLVADQRVGFGDRRFAERLEAGPRIGDRTLERLHRLVRRRQRVAQVAHRRVDVAEIGRAACRERVCQYV